MKNKYYLLLFLITIMLPATGYAQGRTTAIDTLVVDLWPDYDRASVLVLLTGKLSADTKLPATVIFPVPETARLNAVARIDSSDGVMKDDILSGPAPGGFRFTTPDLHFRVEYYLPYAVNSNRRTFNFTWLADLSVNSFQLKVQQPISASSLAAEPAAVDVSKGQDGFTYHAFPVKAVPAGQSFAVDVDYTMTTAQLSAASLAPSGTGAQKPGIPATSNTASGNNRIIAAVIVGSIILVMVFVWQIATRRTASNRPITQDAKDKKQSHAKFCRNCGDPIDKDDGFCRKCGTDL
ncbi:MAG: zinc ribbon domain-containing protein [Desulfobacteraceae bacterium]|nr:zinc ribbon domain-containing protein [Desulfobacteraceae bacterium]